MLTRRRPAHPLLALACLLLATAGALSAAPSDMRAGVFSPPRMAPDFSLPGSHGALLNLRDYRGKLVVLGFGFSHCPEICPVTLAHLAQARRQLGPQASDVQVVYVTVDPERDDAARLRTYLTAFDGSFVGGTGSDEQLRAVRTEYGIAAAKVAKPDGSYGVSHSAFTYLIDRQGRLRALMPYGRTAEDFVHDLQILLSEP